MLVDSLESHLAEAGSIERAAVPMAMYLAWCGNLHLLAPGFQETHAAALTRLRYRDMTPTEFFTACTNGNLDGNLLGDEGGAFTADYYPRYLADFRDTFGSDPYAVEDDWDHYDRIAAVLTDRFMRWKQGGKRESARAGGRRWWQVWRS